MSRRLLPVLKHSIAVHLIAHPLQCTVFPHPSGSLAWAHSKILSGHSVVSSPVFPECILNASQFTAITLPSPLRAMIGILRLSRYLCSGTPSWNSRLSEQSLQMLWVTRLESAVFLILTEPMGLLHHAHTLFIGYPYHYAMSRMKKYCLMEYAIPRTCLLQTV